MNGRPAEFYLARLRKMAHARGGALLSPAYLGDQVKLRFRCAEGHEWWHTPGGIKAGRWCGKCGIARVAAALKGSALARLRRIVARRGGTIVSRDYVNSQTKLRYRCAEGHEWNAVPNSIAVGRWCPVCADKLRMKHHAERKQRVFRRLLRIVKRRGGEILPPGFIDSKTELRYRCARGHTWVARAESIDEGVWCPACKEESLLAGYRAIARRWGGDCLSRSCSSGQVRLLWRCAIGHRFQAPGVVVKQGHWCPRCRQPGPGSIERMRQLAHERGGACLSRAYVDADTKLRWRCREGHEWTSSPGSIVCGTWCPVCRVRQGHQRKLLSIHVMRETAATRGGECLSTAYYGAHLKLRWRCAGGHEWAALAGNVRQGAWCPTCAHSARGTVEGMQALAHEHGGRCLSRAWNNHREPLRFECRRGHRFYASANVVKTGVWCPKCRSATPAPSPARPRVAFPG